MLKPEIQLHVNDETDVEYLKSVIMPSEAEVKENAEKAVKSFKRALREQH
jgi:hypothetical protein